MATLEATVGFSREPHVAAQSSPQNASGSTPGRRGHGGGTDRQGGGKGSYYSE